MKVSDFEVVLNEEEVLLDGLNEKQFFLRKAISEKNWENLSEIISIINTKCEKFAELDEKRQAIQDSLSSSEVRPYFEKLSALRSKLLKFNIENQALMRYVNITRDFIRGIVENVIPQSGTKVYSKYGTIVQPQPSSVVVDRLF
ncbi:MAG: hypothetical protein MJ188_07990 [Treponema sp.]|nr:hypothetical protein [Treponema sp.]